MLNKRALVWPQTNLINGGGGGGVCISSGEVGGGRWGHPRASAVETLRRAHADLGCMLWPLSLFWPAAGDIPPPPRHHCAGEHKITQIAATWTHRHQISHSDQLFLWPPCKRMETPQNGFLGKCTHPLQFCTHFSGVPSS